MPGIQPFDITKKTITLSFFLTFSLILFANGDIHSKARASFIIAGSESCKARDLLTITGSDSDGLVVVKAYNGAAYTLMADCVKSPVKKMKNFNIGKDIIDEAVTRDPSNPEIRYIRIMVQNGVPDFLNYNNLQEDMKAFINLMVKKKEKTGIDDFDKKMAKIILSTDVPDKGQRDLLNTLF